jgi:hypothetical protein
MWSFYYSGEAVCENYPCVVKIDENEILVEYEDAGIQQYRGKNRGDGHFELLSPELGGKASLHMFPGDTLLEGSWVESSYRGMWRIELD